ncbi:DUF6124 family protein [Pseudomonas defluvii]|uniref:DUF6124 family protein n=1 Tax=Pseudomonas defluvii TaxID=1876757 RepID=UPI003905E9D1
MSSHSPDALDAKLDSESLSSSDAARRALDYYLNPPQRAAEMEAPFFVPRPDLGRLKASEHACSLLRCASATAYEMADDFKGTRRDMALSVVHIINMALALVEHSLGERAGSQSGIEST